MDKEPHPTDENRYADGTYKEGHTPILKGYTTWENRVQQIDENYPTGAALLALFTKDEQGKMIPTEELLSRHPRDIAIIMQAIGAFMGDDKARERESFWDRKEGKARQRVALAGDKDNRTPIKADGKFTLTFGTEKNVGSDPDQE